MAVESGTPIHGGETKAPVRYETFGERMGSMFITLAVSGVLVAAMHWSWWAFAAAVGGVVGNAGGWWLTTAVLNKRAPYKPLPLRIALDAILILPITWVAGYKNAACEFVRHAGHR